MRITVIFVVGCLILQGQGLAGSSCRIHGRPSLCMFKQDSEPSVGFQQCQEEGEHVMYENEYIRFTLTVTQRSTWNETYKVVLRDHEKILCIIDRTQHECHHPKIIVDTWRSATRITYPTAALWLSIVHDDDMSYFDIHLHQQNRTIPRQSPTGLCVHSSENARPMHPRTKQFVHTEEICNQHLDQLLSDFMLPLVDQKTRNVSLATCVDDLQSVGDERIAKSFLRLFLLDTLGWDRPTRRNVDDKGICHFYGDPHVLLFPQHAGAIQIQYWCKVSGRHAVLQNEYVHIATHAQNQTWSINQWNITFYDGSNVVLCTISDQEQQCNSPEIRITHPSLTQIDIQYSTAQLQISIVPQQYQLQWYDISIRMPYELIGRSSGLCIQPPNELCDIENNMEQEIPSLTRTICELYVAAGIRASIQLGLFNHTERRNHALLACIHDYQTTGNKNFGASVIDMMIKHGINEQQLDEMDFELQTIASIDIINTAVMNATNHTDALLSRTTTTTSGTPTSTVSNATNHTDVLLSRTTTTTSGTPTSTVSNATVATTSTNIATVTTTSRSTATVISNSISLVVVALLFFI